MNFTLSGKLIEKFETQQVSETFRKREFVVETTEHNAGREFTEQIKFQLTQDKCDLIDNYNKDDSIKINFSIRGRRWEKDGRVNYFTNLDAWRVEPEDQTEDDVPLPEDFENYEDDMEDVPF